MLFKLKQGQNVGSPTNTTQRSSGAKFKKLAVIVPALFPSRIMLRRFKKLGCQRKKSTRPASSVMLRRKSTKPAEVTSRRAFLFDQSPVDVVTVPPGFIFCGRKVLVP